MKIDCQSECGIVLLCLSFHYYLFFFFFDVSIYQFSVWMSFSIILWIKYLFLLNLGECWQWHNIPGLLTKFLLLNIKVCERERERERELNRTADTQLLNEIYGQKIILLSDAWIRHLLFVVFFFLSLLLFGVCRPVCVAYCLKAVDRITISQCRL